MPRAQERGSGLSLREREQEIIALTNLVPFVLTGMARCGPVACDCAFSNHSSSELPACLQFPLRAKS
jgi:hypothetical protein